MAAADAHSDDPVHPRHASPTVSWFELFYDLVVIAAVSLSNDVFLDNPSWDDAIVAALGFIALGWVWFATTLFNNIYPGQDIGRRLLLLLQMALIVTAALTFNSDTQVPLAFLAFAGSLATVPLLMANDRLVNPERQKRVPWRHTMAGPLLLAALLCIVGSAAPTEWSRWILGVALLVSMVPALTWQYRWWQGDPRLRLEHLRERLGLFILIVLGEGFAQLVAALHAMETIPRTGLFALTFLVSFALWWVYFEGTFTEDLDLGRVRWRLTLLGHLTLVLAMAGTLDLLVLLTAKDESEIGPNVMEYFTWSIAGVLVSFALLRFAGHGRLGTPGVLHLATAAGILVMGVVLDQGMAQFHVIVAVSTVAIIVNGVAAAVIDRAPSQRLGALLRGSIED